MLKVRDTSRLAQKAKRSKPSLAALCLEAPIPTWGLTAFLCLLAPAGWAAENMTNALVFAAEGTGSIETFELGKTNPVFSARENFVFVCSNNTWRIDSVYQNGFSSALPPKMQTLPGTRISCSRIADGIRLFVSFPDHKEAASGSARGVARTAQAKPIPFPPPEYMMLFTVWLSFCPRPELPLIDSGVIHRFLITSLLNDPRNQGTYGARYLEPAGLFLSELNITNDGTIFQSATGKASKYPAPFENGYREFSYELTKTTNAGGMAYPFQSVVRRYAPKQNARSNEDLYVYSITRLEVTRLSSTPIDMLPLPKSLVALDSRPPGLNPGIVVTYMVTNDQWQPVTNQELRQLSASFMRLKIPVRRDWRRTLILVALVVVAIAPLAGLLVRKHHQTKPR